MEELQLVLKAVEALGVEGKEAFLAWLIISKIVQPLTIFAGIGFVIFSLKRVCLYVAKNW